MKTKPPSLGICKSAACPSAAEGPIERYDGAGMYCPGCGELLQLYIPGEAAWSIPVVPSRPRSGTSSRRSYPDARLIALVVAIVGTVTFAIVQTMATGDSGGTIGVCRSSMTERLAGGLLHDYGARSPGMGELFELRTTNCSVRFSIGLDAGQHQTTIGHDGIVAIVNRGNRVRTMHAEDLRNILRGKLANWSSIGGRRAPIVAYLPEPATDEARVIEVALMKGAPIGQSVVRLPTSADVLRAVLTTSGTNAIGIVPFSMAAAGNVIALREFAVPSVLSITTRRYPLAVDLVVASADVARDANIAGLLSYAGSDSARAITEKAGMITKGASP